MWTADVRHVDFSHAILNRANLIFAWAKNAHFDNAQLQGADLVSAQLQGALRDGAQLQGAELGLAQLQGAALDGAQLQGAELGSAQLQGASLGGAQLQGASLDQAQLQGAELVGAQLQGASLDGAQLQGAALGLAQLQGASFERVCVWRADARQAAWEDTRVELPKADKMHDCDWTAASFAALKQLIAKEVPEGHNKRLATETIERHLDPTKVLEGEDEIAKVWAVRESEAPTPKAYEKSLAGQWRKTGCGADGAPYVLHALIVRFSPWSSPFRDQSDAAKALAAAFLDETHCAGAHGLSEADKETLEKIAAPAAPQAPKP